MADGSLTPCRLSRAWPRSTPSSRGAGADPGPPGAWRSLSRTGPPRPTGPPGPTGPRQYGGSGGGRAGGRPGAEGLLALELDPGQCVDPDDLDQCLDLRLGAAEHDRAAVGTQPAGEQCQVDHQRRVGERELGQVDGNVGLRPQSPRQRAATASLGAADLVAGATKQGRGVAEGYDCVKVSTQRTVDKSFRTVLASSNPVECLDLRQLGISERPTTLSTRWPLTKK
jgi:hypothetical protein